MTLGEVIVVAHRKLYEQKNGELVANVKGTVLETFPKTVDVIAQLPLVSQQDGNFTVFGKGTPVIYINNRLVQDLKELDRLLPSDIKSIKVSTMPGAKYDATVGSIIWIITEKTQGEGLSGSLYAGTKYSMRWSQEEYASLNCRRNAWDVFGSAYLIHKRQRMEMKANQLLSVADMMHIVDYQENENMGSNYISAVGGLTFNPNEKFSAGLQYVFNHTSWHNNMLDDIRHTVAGKAELMQQLSVSDKPDHSHNINAYFSGNIKDNLSIDVNLDWTEGDETDKMHSWFLNSTTKDVNTASNRQYDYYASKGILTYAVKYVSLETGVEYSHTDMTQTYDIDNTSLGINNSNDVTKQNRWALFVTGKVQFGNWGFGAGLRYENVNFDYYKNELLDDELSKKYRKLFPNIFALYSKEDIQATLGYERKIKYPSYNALRSNIQYSSPYIYESGNPVLLPQIQNAITCVLGYKDSKIILGYAIYENYMTQLVELYDGKSIAVMRPENVSDVKSRFFAVSYTPIIGFWQPNIEVGGQWQDFSISGKKYEKPIFKIQLNNSLSFSRQWFLSVNAGWQSGGNSGIYLLKSSLQTSATVTKWLLGKRLSVSLMVNDIFKNEKTRWRINHNCVVFDYDKYSDSRYMRLTVQYNFNTTRSKYKGNSSSDEKERL